ncbi:MAG: hypothetical protein LBT91_01640, partial [Bifidobacteriaceae bacterium]|nr:hypothetical protein [Bifidobacteriaceae bacterium]
LGIWGIIFLFGICAFISGFNINSYAASSSTILPISRGGTGANTFASGQALIGAGSNSLTTKAIDTVPTDGSANLITSGALKTVSNVANIGQGKKTGYYTVNTADNGTQEIIVLGQVPTDDTKRASLATIYSGELTFQRCLPHIASCPASLRRFSIDFVLGGRPQEVTADRIHMKCISADACALSPPYMSLGTFLYNENMYIGLYPKTPGGGYGQALYMNGWIQNIGGCADFACPSEKVLKANITDWVELKALT